LKLRLSTTVALATSLTLGAASCGVSNFTSGTDCNPETATELDKQFDSVERPTKTRLTTEEVIAAAEAYREFRSFVRRLVLPSIAEEQTAYVNALEDFILGLTRYQQSGGLDTSVNETVVPLGDARDDFLDAFDRECLR